MAAANEGAAVGWKRAVGAPAGNASWGNKSGSSVEGGCIGEINWVGLNIEDEGEEESDQEG